MNVYRIQLDVEVVHALILLDHIHAIVAVVIDLKMAVVLVSCLPHKTIYMYAYIFL